MKKWILLGLAIISEVVATLSLKGAMDYGALYIVVAVGYVSAFYILAQVIKLGTPVGVAYGIWAAVGVSLTALLSALIFKEPLTPLMIAGIAIIIVGVLLVELGTGHHSKAKKQSKEMN